MASSILAITGNDLPFASLGGKYPRLELNQLGLCHARHTKKAAALRRQRPKIFDVLRLILVVPRAIALAAEARPAGAGITSDVFTCDATTIQQVFYLYAVHADGRLDICFLVHRSFLLFLFNNDFLAVYNVETLGRLNHALTAEVVITVIGDCLMVDTIDARSLVAIVDEQ